MMPKTPPNTRNCETWSTSLVTRETRAPRCSVFWVSSGRSWTCRKALIRSVARPRSEAVNSRAVMKYDDTPVATIASAASTAICGDEGDVDAVGSVDALVEGLLHRDGYDDPAGRPDQRRAASSSRSPRRARARTRSPRRIVSRAEISSPLSTLVPSSISSSGVEVDRHWRHPLGLVGVDQRGVGRVAVEQLLVGARGRRCVRRRGRAPRRPARSSPCGRRSRSSVESPPRWRIAARMRASTSGSTAEVASSSTSRRGRRTSARASESRWRWPPDRVVPRSPSRLSSPSRQRGDEAVGLGGAQGRPHLLVGDVGAQGDVAAHRVVEEERALRHQRRRGSASCPAGEVAQVVAVDADGARLRVDQPGHQRGERALARRRSRRPRRRCGRARSVKSSPSRSTCPAS